MLMLDPSRNKLFMLVCIKSDTDLLSDAAFLTDDRLTGLGQEY